MEGEVEPVNKAWDQLLAEKQPVTVQTSTRQLWQALDLDADGNVQWSNTHIMLAMYPDFDEKGDISSIMSCVTDIR